MKQDLIQAKAIEEAILKTKTFYARVAVIVAKAALIVAERELQTLEENKSAKAGN